MTVLRYAAIGDSFTEGLGDPYPDGSDRGWADRVAAGMAQRHDVDYVNIAISGRLIEPIATDQLETVLALRPDLITFNGGGNDIMRPGTDVGKLRAFTERVLLRCQIEGVRVVVLSGANPSRHLPMGKRIDRLGQVLTDVVRDLAAAYDVLFVDNFSDTELGRAHYWSEDRMHMNSLGHERVSHRVLDALGYDIPVNALAEHPDPDRVRRALENARYYREHVTPWVVRRLRGISSGDSKQPKRPDWRRVEPGFAD